MSRLAGCLLLALLLSACGPVRADQDTDVAVARPEPAIPEPAMPFAAGAARLGFASVLGTGNARELTTWVDGAWTCVAWDGTNDTCSEGAYIDVEEGTFLRSLGGYGDEDVSCMEWASSADVQTLKVTTEDGTRWVLEPLDRSLELLGAHLFAACVPGEEFLRDHFVTGFDASGERIAAYPANGQVR